MRPLLVSPVRGPVRPTTTASLLAAAVLAALGASARAQVQFVALARQGFPTQPSWSHLSIALGDVDSDGDLDVITGTGGAWGAGRYTAIPNVLYLNDGHGTFGDATASHLPQVGSYSLGVALGDVDGDSDLDIVSACIADYTGDQNMLWLNNGTGMFHDATSASMPARTDFTRCVALGDVDGDGDLDIIFGSGYLGLPSVNQNRLLLNNGSGTFRDATSTQLPIDNDFTQSLACGDIDGDGSLDIVSGNGYPFGQQNRLYTNNGAGQFTDATATTLPPFLDQTFAVALGDVDGDGDLDLVCGNYREQDRLYLNNRGVFTDVTQTHMPADRDLTLSVALGDVDGDGDLDLVCGAVQSNPSQYKRLYLNNGRGAYVDATPRLSSSSPGIWPSGIALGDIDDDGDLDIVTADFVYSQSLFNLQRQLHAPVDLQIGQTYTLDAYLRYVQPTSNTFALPYGSFRPASIPRPPYGTIGIDPALAIPLPLISIPQPAGVGTLTLSMPNAPGLVGLPVYFQAVLVPYPYQAKLSNVVRDVVQ